MIKFTFMPTGNVRVYENEYDIKDAIRVLEKVQEKLDNDFILNSGTLNNHLFDVNYGDRYEVSNTLFDIVQSMSGKRNIWEAVSLVCDKDEEWGKWRNNGLEYEAYHKYTMKPEHAEKMNVYIKGWIEELSSILENVIAEKERSKQKRIEEQNKFTIVNIYQETYHSGGEGGVDGYFDADIKCNETGETIRVVAKDLFDVGRFTYPKRVEGTEELLEHDKWNEQERSACNWMSKFSPFKTAAIRM